MTCPSSSPGCAGAPGSRTSTWATGGAGCASTARARRSRSTTAASPTPTPASPPRASVEEQVAVGAGEHRFAVAADGFWQVHPGAPRDAGRHRRGDARAGRRGSGSSTSTPASGSSPRFLADAVGPEGEVVAVEGDRTASLHARTNLAGAPGCASRPPAATSPRCCASAYDEPFDLVVLDPPRGCQRAVVDAVVAAVAAPGTAYVAGDPVALARDLGLLAERGWTTTTLRAFDLFPMTHHVECVALRTGGSAGRWPTAGGAARHRSSDPADPGTQSPSAAACSGVSSSTRPRTSQPPVSRPGSTSGSTSRLTARNTT